MAAQKGSYSGSSRGEAYSGLSLYLIKIFKFWVSYLGFFEQKNEVKKLYHIAFMSWVITYNSRSAPEKYRMLHIIWRSWNMRTQINARRRCLEISRRNKIDRVVLKMTPVWFEVNRVQRTGIKRFLGFFCPHYSLWVLFIRHEFLIILFGLLISI